MLLERWLLFQRTQADSQHLCGSSQPSVTPGEPIPSASIKHTHAAQMYMQAKHPRHKHVGTVQTSGHRKNICAPRAGLRPQWPFRTCLQNHLFFQESPPGQQSVYTRGRGRVADQNEQRSRSHRFGVGGFWVFMPSEAPGEEHHSVYPVEKLWSLVDFGASHSPDWP